MNVDFQATARTLREPSDILGMAGGCGWAAASYAITSRPGEIELDSGLSPQPVWG